MAQASADVPEEPRRPARQVPGAAQPVRRDQEPGGEEEDHGSGPGRGEALARGRRERGPVPARPPPPRPASTRTSCRAATRSRRRARHASSGPGGHGHGPALQGRRGRGGEAALRQGQVGPRGVGEGVQAAGDGHDAPALGYVAMVADALARNLAAVAGADVRLKHYADLKKMLVSDPAFLFGTSTAKTGRHPVAGADGGVGLLHPREARAGARRPGQLRREVHPGDGEARLRRGRSPWGGPSRTRCTSSS